MEKRIGNDWDQILEEEFQKDYYKKMEKFLLEEYRAANISSFSGNIVFSLYSSSRNFSIFL